MVGIMRNKKGGAPFVESTTLVGYPSVRSYGRTDESIFRLLHLFLRFLPVTNLAHPGDGYLEGELHRLAVTWIVHLDGLYLAVGIDVDVNTPGDTVGKQVNQLV